MNKHKIIFTSLVVSLLFLSCSNPSVDIEGEEFRTALQQLSDAYGDEQKSDFLGLDPCEILEPILSFGDEAVRSGFFVGVQGGGVLAGLANMGGADLVWDYYHAQLSVSSYASSGLNFTGGGNVNASVYAGWVTGFNHGVSDWDGQHYQVTTELGLPFIKEYVHLKPEAFVVPKDQNEDREINIEDIRLNGDGLYGFSLGLGISLELFPNPLPVDLEISQGVWHPNEAGIMAIYERLKTARLIPVIGEPLAISLINPESGESCGIQGIARLHHSDHAECVIQLGDPSWSHTRNAFHVAASMCALTMGCAVPLAWPQSVLALGIGAWRDHIEANEGKRAVCD